MQVFLSHSSIDKDFVRILKNDLQNAGITTWFDEDNISYGDSLIDRINEGLENSDYTLLIISSAFLISKWSAWESNAAIASAITNKANRVIPILIEDVWNNISPLLRDKLYADFRDHGNLIKYRIALDELIRQILATPSSNKPISSPRVMVTGSKDPAFRVPAFETAYEIGQILASKKLNLLTGIADGVDTEFARGANEMLISMGENPRQYITCYKDSGKTANHAYGRIITSRLLYREQGIPELISEADIVVLLGGGKHTSYLGMVAMLEQKVVLPVASTNGVANDLYTIALIKFDKLYSSKFDKSAFIDLADTSLSPSQIANVCTELIECIRRL